jgi:Uncharacterized protein conserved in bacteria (DUF2147)
MKKLLALAAFLLASSTAQAQYQFEYGGRTIKIDPDRGTVSIPGVYDNSGSKKSKRAKSDQNKSDQKQAPAPSTADTAPQAAPAPTVATQPPPPAPASPLPDQATTTANNAPADNNTLPPPPAPPPPLPTTSAIPPIQADAPPTAPPPPAPPPPAPTVAAVPAAPPPPPPALQRPVTPAAAPRDPNSPVGVWLTEEKEGKVRIEQCGSNLCGYSVDAKSNLNGEQVLINMKPGKDLKWSGRILDPNTGSTYDSTIALKGSDTLRVQGCAFGGMFCGGQTWTRVN